MEKQSYEGAVDKITNEYDQLIANDEKACAQGDKNACYSLQKFDPKSAHEDSQLKDFVPIILLLILFVSLPFVIRKLWHFFKSHKSFPKNLRITLSIILIWLFGLNSWMLYKVISNDYYRFSDHVPLYLSLSIFPILGLLIIYQAINWIQRAP